MKRPLYEHLAVRLQAMRTCAETGNAEWLDKHEAMIKHLCKHHLPSGSGIDTGTEFNFDASTPERLVLTTAFHHMNDVGSYDGWTSHNVIITPSLTSKFNLRITGSNRNDIKEYLTDVFDAAIKAEIDITPYAQLEEVAS